MLKDVNVYDFVHPIYMSKGGLITETPLELNAMQLNNATKYFLQNYHTVEFVLTHANLDQQLFGSQGIPNSKESHVPRCAFVLKGIMRSIIVNDLYI